MNPRYLDLQFEPFDMIFRRADGKLIHNYPGVDIELDDHTVGFSKI